MSIICNLCRVSDAQLSVVLKDPEIVVDFVEQVKPATDLDKAWHGIHWLLTGSAHGGKEPLCYLQAGGKEIGDVDLGYGPGRAINSRQTASFAEALNAISEAEFRKRFDPAALMSEMIYPEIWDRDPADDDTLGYLVEYFNGLKLFVGDAATAKAGLIIYYN